jgi:Secretion system C-terminal sorting domain/Reelin subrepeat B
LNKDKKSKKNMIKFTCIIILLFLFNSLTAQIWTEDFDGTANWGTLNQDIGSQGSTANIWYISNTEANGNVGTCGFSGGGDQSLHLGSTTLGDLGAAYDAGGWGTGVTNRRSQSQNINTTGISNMTLNFAYMERGEGSNDNCVLEYSINGGSTWIQLVDLAKTPLTCNPQGIWTPYSILLPASCENITNLRIGFRWYNNDDGAGSDPSFAVDDITITTPLPIELLSFKGKIIDSYNELFWSTSSETNNDYFILEKSFNGYNFVEIAEINGAGNSNELIEYSLVDKYPIDGINYYRLKQVDYDGCFSYSKIISLNNTKEHNNQLKIEDVSPNPATTYINLSLNKSIDFYRIEIYDLSGKLVMTKNRKENTSNININIANLSKGVYLLKLMSSDETHTTKFIVRGKNI